MPDAFANPELAVWIERREPSPGMVTLRGDLAAPAFAAAVAGATGCGLPAVRRIVSAGDNAAAWMSPDEVLLILAPGAAAGAVAAIEAALAGSHFLAADVSDARAVFRIGGPGARGVLASGAPVDLAPAAFGPGDFRRTRLGQVAAAFWMRDADSFEVVCFRSVAGFVADWLAGAARPGHAAPDLFPA